MSASTDGNPPAFTRALAPLERRWAGYRFLAGIDIEHLFEFRCCTFPLASAHGPSPRYTPDLPLPYGETIKDVRSSRH